jgi:tetratricopeptide (TPR) repeat protein
MNKLCIAFGFCLLIGCQTRTGDANAKILLTNKAKKFYESDLNDSAAYYYSKLIILDSSDGILYFDRGKSFAKLLLIEPAVKDFLHSAALNYRRSSSFYNIGVVYSNVEDSLAKTYFEKALVEDPNNTKARKKLDECLNRIHGR